MKRCLSSMALAACCLIVLTLTGPGGVAPARGAAALGLQDDFIRVAEQLKPSVVSLKAVSVVTYRLPGPDDFFRGASRPRTWRCSPLSGGGRPSR